MPMETKTYALFSALMVQQGTEVWESKWATRSNFSGMFLAEKHMGNKLKPGVTKGVRNLFWF